MSLIEVLMAMGAVGGLALLITRLTDSGIQSVKTIESKYEIQTVKSEVNSYLSNMQTCKDNFAGLKPDEIKAFDFLHHFDGATEIQRFVKNQENGLRGLKITEFKFGGNMVSFSPGSEIVSSDLKLRILKTSKAVGALDTQEKISIFSTRDGSGKIVSCSSRVEMLTASGIGKGFVSEYSQDCTDWDTKFWPSKEACMRDGRSHKVYGYNMTTAAQLNELAYAIDSGAKISISWTPSDGPQARRTITCDRMSVLQIKGEIDCKTNWALENYPSEPNISAYIFPLNFSGSVTVEKLDRNGVKTSSSLSISTLKFYINVRY